MILGSGLVQALSSGPIVETDHQIDADADCGYIASNGAGYNGESYNTNLYVGDNTSSLYDFAFYYRVALDFAIADGATVSATVKFYVIDKYSGDADVLVGIEDTDNSSNPTNKADLTGRTFSTFVSESGSWPTYSDPDWVEVDVSSSLQEVVDSQAGLSSGDYVGVYVKDADSGWSGVNRRYKIASYDYTDSTKRPILSVGVG